MRQNISIMERQSATLEQAKKADKERSSTLEQERETLEQQKATP
jgi:hypothetical protein